MGELERARAREKERKRESECERERERELESLWAGERETVSEKDRGESERDIHNENLMGDLTNYCNAHILTECCLSSQQ